MSLFPLDSASKRKLLIARAKANAQRVVRTVAKHFALAKDQANPAPVLEQFSLCTPGETRRFRVARSRKCSRPSVWAGLQTPSE